MKETHEKSTTNNNTLGWVGSLIICFLIVIIGAGALYYIYTTEPSARRAAGTKSTAMLVDVTTVDTGTFRPQIEVMGTVTPAKEIVLRPRVSGKILSHSSSFSPGSIVEKGDTLVQIDASDYRNDLDQRQSELREAKADLKIEMGRQDVAQEEYQLLDRDLTDKNKDLVLRKPQLNAARANVELARSAVEQSRLELQRTTINSPFDAKILQRNVNIGSQVSVGDNLARITGMDTYWVETTVPLSKLHWLSFPDTAGATGSKVRIRNRSAWPQGVYRTGHLQKLVGELDNQARMAKVLVTISDPLARDTATKNAPPLLIDSFVETKITGKKIKNVVRLESDFVRDNETVWVFEDGKLNIRDVNVAYQDEKYAFISNGLKHDDQVVTTNLSTVVDGAPLRIDKVQSPENTSSKKKEKNNTASDSITS